MRNLFASIKNAERNSLVWTETIDVAGFGAGNVPITIVNGSGQLLKNGSSLNDGLVKNGDRLAVGITTSPDYATSSFVILRIANEDVIVSVTTKADESKYVDGTLGPLTPLELTKYRSGQDYIPNAIDNVVSIYNTDGTFVESVPAKAPAVQGTTTNDVIVVADFYSRNILKIDSVTRQVVRAIEVGNRPYGVAHTPTSDSNADSLTWVSVSEEDKVVVLDKNHQVVATHYTGEKPMGIAVTIDGKHLFVANNAANTVTHFALEGSTWTSVDIAVGAKPFEVATDLRGNAWISCTGTNRVYCITRTNVLTSYVVGNGPRGLLIDGSGNVWVALGLDSAVARLNPGTSVVTKIPTRLVPFALALGKDGSIYVSNFGDSTIQRISPQTNAVISTLEVPKFPYGITVADNGQLWVANLYSNTPSYLYDYDQTPIGFAIQDQPSVRPNTLVTSNTVTVAEVNVETPVSVPNLYGARIFKNGVDVGQTTTVVNGDTLAYEFTTPQQYDTRIEMPIFVGTQTDSFIAQIPKEDVTPNAFSFTPKKNAEPDLWYTSSSITVLGIDTTARLTAATTLGTVIVNGVDSGLTSVSNIQLNDTLAIRAKSSLTNEETLYVTLNVGTVSAIWELTTHVVDDRLFIKPGAKNASLGVYEPWITTSAGGKSLVRIATDAPYAQTSYDLSASTGLETVREPSTTDRYVPAFFNGHVYRVSPTGELLNALHSELVSGHRPIAQARNGDDVLIAVVDTASVYNALTGQSIVLPSEPRSIKAFGGNVFVGLANGSVLKLTRAGDGTYSISSTVAVGDIGLYALEIDSTGVIWVSGLKTDRVYKIVGNTVALSVPNAGGDIWAMRSDATHLWTANSYDNTVSKINLNSGVIEARIKVGSAPSLLEIDGSGNVWVYHYATNSLLVLNKTTHEKIDEIVLEKPALSLEYRDGAMWVALLAETLVTAQDRLRPLVPMGIAFDSQVDVKRGSTVRSETKTITELIRPVTVKLKPSAGHRLFVNGVSVTSATVDNGDVLAVEIDTSSDYYVESVAQLSEPLSTIDFFTRTEPDVYPDSVLFTTQYGIYVRQRVVSDTVTISGISPNAVGYLTVTDPLWQIILNGSPQPAGGLIGVRTGDTVAIAGPANGTYGGALEYSLIQPSLIEGEEPSVVGTFTTIYKELDGPVPVSARSSYFIKAEWMIAAPKSVHDTDVVTSVALKEHSPQVEIASREIDSNIAYSLKEIDAREIISNIAYSLKEIDAREITSNIGYALKEIDEELIATNNIGYSLKELDVERIIESAHGSSFSGTFQPEFDSWRMVLHSSENVEYEVKSRRNRYYVLAADVYGERTPERSAVYSERLVAPEYIKSEVPSASHPIAYEFEPSGVSVSRHEVDPAYVLGLNAGIRTTDIQKWEKESGTVQRVAPPPSYDVHHTPEVRNVEPTAIQGAVYKFVKSPIAEYVKAVAKKHATTEVPEAVSIHFKSLHTVGVNFVHSGSYGAREVDTSMPVRLPMSGRPSQSYEVDVQLGYVSRPYRALNTVGMPTAEVLKFSRDRLIERPAFSRYIVHDYTVDEDAATEGAYESAADAVAAGVAAGFPLAYAVLLPRGHYMWATPMDRDAGPPPMYPIPAKWYVHGG